MVNILLMHSHSAQVPMSAHAIRAQPCASIAGAGLHNVAILHEWLIIVKLGCTVEVFFMLVCLKVVHGALVSPER
jgi:hypothetical protein